MWTPEPGPSLPDTLSRRDLGFATLAGITGLAGSYAVAGTSRQFLLAPIDALVVRLTPGQVVAFAIQSLGDAGHLLHLGLAVLLAVGLLGGTVLVGFVAGRQTGHPVLGLLVAGGLTWLLSTAITAHPVLALGPTLPVALVTAIGSRAGTAAGTPAPDRRRAILAGAAGALALVGISVGLGRLVSESAGPGAGQGSETDGDPVDEAVATMLADAGERSLDVAGDVPGLVSPASEFYNTDIAQFDPDLSAEGWDLTFTGEVDTERTVPFAELTEMPTEHRFETLRCVGESLNGHKLDTAVWTGTPLKPLLDDVDPEGACGCAMLHAEDGYFVQFPVAALEEGFLAWKMNGRPLPKSHGHPVRVLVPGHWGETNVKWLSEIELLEEAADGYWEKRGWHGTGPVETVAKLWSDTVLDDGQIEVAGHAYAGTREVDRVEVSTDGGETWTDAELSAPLPGTDVWRQWRHVFDPEGRHEVVVRAIDGEGNLQPETEADAFPSGATGWVRKRVSA